MKYFAVIIMLIFIAASTASSHPAISVPGACETCPVQSSAQPTSKVISQAIKYGEYYTVPGSSIRIRFVDKPKTRSATQNEVANVQSYLHQLGFNPGPIDGAMGPKTRRAIKDFQNAWGLPVDGKITNSLVRELKAMAHKK